jgi:serine protease Do
MKKNKILRTYKIFLVIIGLIILGFLFYPYFNEKLSGRDIPKSSSEIYQESSLAIVKIFEYSGWDLFLPDYEYDVSLDKFVPLSNDINILEDPDSGLAIEQSAEYGPTSYGSGFIISDDGYILTNAHVISNLEIWEENLRTDLMLYDYAILLDSYYSGDMDEETYEYYNYLNDYLYEYIEIIPRVDYKVVVGVDTNAVIYVPEIIKTEGGTYEDIMDWTLLKIDASNLDHLRIADSNEVMEGSEILVIGYPSVSEEDYSEKIEFKNDIKPTINGGIVSHIKDEGLYKIFQIDASASSGNSGGPVLDKKGKVIGILTSGIDGYDGGIYNYAQRINDIFSQISNYI